MEENMRGFTTRRLQHSLPAAIAGGLLAVGIATTARANVITDWDEKAVAFLQPSRGAASATRRLTWLNV